MLQFIAEADQTSFIVAGAIVGGILLLAILGNAVTSGAPSVQRFSKRRFRSVGRRRGLNREEVRFLLNTVKRFEIASPMKLFSSVHYLRANMKRIYQELGPEAAAVVDQRRILRIMARLSAQEPQSDAVSSRRLVQPDQQLTVEPAGFRAIRVTVAAVDDQGIGFVPPTDRNGKAVRWRSKTQITCELIVDEKPFSFQSTVLGYRDHGGKILGYIAHVEAVAAVQKRRSPRIDLSRACLIYPVIIVEEGRGRKKKRRAEVVKDRRVQGVLTNVSAGGCAVSCRRPPAAGTLIKVQFELKAGVPVDAYGKIKSLETNSRYGAILHVQFTRLSAAQTGEIMAVVYELADAD